MQFFFLSVFAEDLTFAKGGCQSRQGVRIGDSRATSTAPLFELRQPAAAQLLVRHVRQVWLDVEDRSSVDHVEAADVQAVAIAAEQLDDRQGDRVRTVG